MITCSSARRLLSPIEDPEKLISRRNQSQPSLLFHLEEDDMAGQTPPQGPIPDLLSMEELLQAPTDGVRDAIVESMVPQPRSPTQTPVPDEIVYEDRGDSVERAATTATSLEAEQGSDDMEDPSKQGRKIAKIDQDPGISLVQHDAEIQGRYGHDMEFDFVFDAAKEVSTAEKDVSTAEQVSTVGAIVTTASVAVSTVSPTRNTGVSTADDITMAETLVYIRKSAAKDKGKGKMDESENVKTKTKLQQEQERLDFEIVVRLQTEFEKELQAEEREKYTEAEQVRMLVELINQRKRRANELHMIIVPEQGMNVKALQTKYLIIDWEIYTEGTRKYWKIIRDGNHTKVHQLFDDMLKAFDMDDLVMLWSLIKEKFNSTEPTDDKEKEIWVALKKDYLNQIQMMIMKASKENS
ncbi:hypothetical protein Tco_0141062 [Tanacetum coccineum]